MSFGSEMATDTQGAPSGNRESVRGFGALPLCIEDRQYMNTAPAKKRRRMRPQPVRCSGPAHGPGGAMEDLS